MTLRLYLAILLLFATTGITAAKAAASAERVLERAAMVFNQSKSMKAAFTTDSDGAKSTGTITLQGDRFCISSDDFSTWYDGKTQWSYSSATGEVNVSEPTPEELAQVNPFVIISNLRKTYNAIPLKSAAGTSKVQLTPKDSRHADIKKAIITFNDKTSLPTHIVLEMASGSKMSITVKSIAQGGILPVSTFTFDNKKFPGAEIIDLR